MNEPTNDLPFYARTGYRVATAIFALVFIACGAYVLFIESPTRAAKVAGVVLLLLGIDSLVSSVRAKRSWVSRVGPLP
jgi:hypothetical protein